MPECACIPPSCNPQTDVFVYDEAVVSVYADRVGAQGGTNNWIRCLAIICLRLNRLPYAKKTPGDCGTATGVQGNMALGLGVTALKTGLSAVPIIGGLLASLSSFIPFAHHAQAVANEQATLCDVSVNWAGFSSAMEQALRSKQIGLQDAVTRLDQFAAQLKAELATISNSAQKNAGYGYSKAVDALVLFDKEAVYPSLVPGVLSSLSGSRAGVGALAVGAGVAAAKIIGVF